VRCDLDALKRHSDTKKHISECQKRGLNVHLDTNELSSLSFEDRKKIAEIKFAALIVEKNIPFQMAESILSFFQDVGKDPEILKSMTMNRNKAPKVINKVLYAREQERLVEILQNNKFSIFIDETSDINNEKWMTFLVRYVEPQTLDVRTELLELIQLDASDCTAKKLFTTFRDEMCKKKIPFENILALSCDNASVMTGKYESFKTKLQKYCKNLITMPCPCHASALVANAACKAIPEACEELLRKVASFITSSPKRACIFKQFQNSFNCNERKILKLSETRWLSRHLCVARLNENWNVLLKFLQEEQLSEKSKSGAALLATMQNPEVRAYSLFLEYILDAFNKFNASFQAQETKVYLLQSAAENLLKTILRNVVKNPLLNFVADSTINLSDTCNRLYIDKVLVGPACQDFLDQLNQEQDKTVKSIYANCFSFYDIAAKEIRQKLFVKEEVLNKLRIFDPKVALQEDTTNEIVEDVILVAKRFGGFDDEMLRKEWQFLNISVTLEQREKLKHLDFDNAWKTIVATKDTDGNLQYPMICKLINTIRSLPNSNADAERVFFMLTDIKTKKRNSLNPIHVQALCVFKSNLKARGHTAQTMTIDARHLTLMSSENLHQTNARKDACFLRLLSMNVHLRLQIYN